MFNILKFQIYPEVKGIVTMNETPVEGAIVSQYFEFNSRKKSTTFTTGRDGIFYFQERKVFTLSNLMPFDSRAFQKITIKFNNAEYTAWEAFKTMPENFPDFSNKLSSLLCELGSRENIKPLSTVNTLKHYNIYGLSSWHNQ